jgi:hypothetical protein
VRSRREARHRYALDFENSEGDADMRLDKMVSAAMAQHKKISALPGKLQ